MAPRARQLAAAGLAGLAAQQLALVVALRLAADGSRSGPAVFTVATAVFLLPWAVLAVPVATSAYPDLASADDHGFGVLVGRTLRVVLLLTLGGAAVLAAVAVPAGALLGGGHPQALADAVRAFAPGLPGYGLLALLTRALYARDAGRAAATGTVTGWLAVAVADLALVRGTGLAPATALGLGNALGMTLAAAVLLVALHRRSPAAVREGARTLGVGGAAALLVGLAPLALPLPAAPGVPAALLLGAGLGLGAAVAYAAAVVAGDPAAVRALRRG